MNDAGIGRIVARANPFVTQRVVDADVAHLEPSKILIGRCRFFEPLFASLFVRSSGLFWMGRFGRGRRYGMRTEPKNQRGNG